MADVQSGAPGASLEARLEGLEGRLDELRQLPQQVGALQSVPQLLDSALEALAQIIKRLPEQPPQTPTPALQAPAPVEVFHSPSAMRAIKRAKERHVTSYSSSSGEVSSKVSPRGVEALVPLIGQRPPSVSRGNAADNSGKTANRAASKTSAQRRPSNASIAPQRRPSTANVGSHMKFPNSPAQKSIAPNVLSLCSGPSRPSKGDPEERLADVLPGALDAGDQDRVEISLAQQTDEAALTETSSAQNTDDGDQSPTASLFRTPMSPIPSQEVEFGFMRPRASRQSKNSVISLASSATDSQEDLACMAGILHRTYEPRVPLCVMPPLSPLRLVWDALVLLTTVFTGVSVPILFVHLGGGDPPSYLVVHAMCAVDLIWLIDIFMNFRTGFFSGIGGSRQVLSPRRIALRYLRSWLVLDLLAAWPLAFQPTEAIVSSSLVSSSVLTLKLLRVPRLWSMFSKLHQKKSQYTSILVFQVAVGLLLLSHLLACVWRLAQRADGSEPELADGYSFGAYVQDMYWVVMTMTTVGYGDVSAYGTVARLYAMLVMLTAPMYFGSIVSLLTHAMSGLIDSRIESSVAEARRFMLYRSVPVELQRRVMHNLRHNLHQERLTNLDSSLLAHLSPAVQRELSLALLSRTVLRFPLFRGVTYSFVADLARVHTWVQCLPGDLVVEEGQLEQELVFVVHGRLLLHGAESSLAALGGTVAAEVEAQAALGDGAWEDTPAMDTLCAGAWFGEACLFDRNHVRTSTVIALVESELAVLAAADFFRIMEKYPRLQERHALLDTAFREKQLHLWELAYHTPEKTPCQIGSLKKRDSVPSCL